MRLCRRARRAGGCTLGSAQGREERADGRGGGGEPDERREPVSQGRPHARTTSLPSTRTFTGASGELAGPCTTSPVAASKRLPWHGHRICPSLTDATRQPWCVHTAEKPRTSLPARVST